MKKNRQDAILTLIDQEDIATQEALMHRLQTLGYSVTQATVSRDIKSLNLVKRPGADGRSYYTVKKSESQDASEKFYSILSHSAHHVDFAGNMVVVKCYSGMANAACAAVDALISDRIVGTLAGDDTFFIVCRDEASAGGICDLLKNFIQNSQTI